MSQNAACLEDQLWGNTVAFVILRDSSLYPLSCCNRELEEFVALGSHDGGVLPPVSACNCWTGDDDDHRPALDIADVSASLPLNSGRKNPFGFSIGDDVTEFTSWGTCGSEFFLSGDGLAFLKSNLSSIYALFISIYK